MRFAKKTFQISLQFLREQVGKLLSHVPGHCNVSDVLTKTLTSQVQDKHLKAIGVVFLEGKSAKQKQVIGSKQ